MLSGNEAIVLAIPVRRIEKDLWGYFIAFDVGLWNYTYATIVLLHCLPLSFHTGTGPCL